MKRIVFTTILLTCTYLKGISQQIIRNLILKTDTLEYSLKQNTVIINGEKQIAFRYEKDDETSEIKLYKDDRMNVTKIEILNSQDYQILDSVVCFNDEYYILRLRFKNLTQSKFLSLRFKIFTDSSQYKIEEFNLLPCTHTYINLYNPDNELFIGEEKIFELISNNPNNLRLGQDWICSPDFDYRITNENNQLRLHLVPKVIGRKTLSVKLRVNKPGLTESKQLSFEITPMEYSYFAKSGRLAFLNPDKKEITFDDISRKEGIEIQIDKNRSLQLQKTYRIEEQEAPGGALIAELFTRQNLNNDKVLCRMRVYNLHMPTVGYLYIKEGDDAKFITNFGISPKTSITKISILRNGVDWIESNNVNPGETINLRLEGEGLNKARFLFEDIESAVQDSVVKTDNVAEFRITIPLNISKKKIFIYNQGENTHQFLQVKEYQLPRIFDFITINFGNGNKIIDNFSGPELYEKTIKNISLSFSPEKIDSIGKLYGKQYVDVLIRITGSRGELIELTNLPVLVICPSEASPRHAYYDLKDCNREDISFNTYLNRKTYDLDDWTKIAITFKHPKDKYSGQGMEKTVEIILQRSMKFDIDVSFPSLLTKIVKEEGWQNGLGISMATIAQFSFYEKDKIAQLMPYKIGVGFLALNAFNFSASNTYRDLGLVVLGSLYPTRRDTKFSFPLYIGGGYLLNKKSWFWVFGPGIRVSF